MRHELQGGYEIDDDRDRIDVDVVCAYLAEESYWARGRARDLILKTIREATRVLGVYEPEGGAQVGYARVVSDEVVFAYLADVFVLDAARGRGLGVELVRAAVDHPPHKDLRWLLGTLDAHALYERFGFKRPTEMILERAGKGFAPTPE